MRTALGSVVLLAVVAVGCAKKEEAPPPDTTAPVAMAPAPLTAADVAGAWKGMTMATSSDSVTARWGMSGDGNTGKILVEGSKDSIAYTTTYAGDSLMATSVAYTDPTLPKGTPKVTFVSVGRLSNGKLAGTVTLHLASKPDSVIGGGRWEATKAP